MAEHTPFGVCSALMIDLKPSPKGLIVGTFTDYDGRGCVVQESSSSVDSCLWLGVDWGLHGDPSSEGRMHITKSLALELIPILRHFARTGTLGYDDPTQRFQVGTWVIGVGPQNKGIHGRVLEVSVGVYLMVQDNARLPPAGQITCTWDQVDLIWEALDDERQDLNPTLLERILCEGPPNVE